MIVSEDQVSAALNYLADAETAAQATYEQTVAENKAKEAFARLYLSYTGTISEREHRATCNPEYAEAREIVAVTTKEVKRHERLAASSKMVCEIFRTENANARAAEKVR